MARLRVRRLGERRAARATFGEMLERATSRSDRRIDPEIALAMYGLALAVEPDDFRDGARLSGAVARLREDAGGLRLTLWPQDEEIEDRFEQPLIEALGDDAYRKAHGEGRALSFEQALELARSLAGF